MSKLQIGDKAPAINAIDQNTNSINLESLSGKKSSAIFLSKRYDSWMYCSVL